MSAFIDRRSEGMARPRPDPTTPKTNTEYELLQSDIVDTHVVNDSLMPRHVCHPRKEHHHWFWNVIQAWWLVPIHLALAVVVTTVLFQIDDMGFRDNSNFGDNMNDTSTLNPSDITTIVSILLVITRIFASAWQALCAWRCVFVLLEKAGIRLEDIQWILSRGLLIPPLHKCSSWHVLSALALLMAWPALLSSPIAQGSLNWSHAYEYQWGGNFGSVPSVTEMQSHDWHVFANDRRFRETVVKSAAGRAAMAYRWNDIAAQLRPVVAQRISPAFERQEMLGSLIMNITAPAIYLDGGFWVEEDLPAGINASLLESHSGYLNITGELSPLLLEGLPGNAAILKDWKSVSVSGDRDLWTGEQFAALLVGSSNGTDDSDCIRRFAPQTGRIFRKSLDNNIVNCYQVLKLNVTAGITDCETRRPLSCQVGNSSIATLSFPSGQRVPVRNDVVLPVVFGMMPEVMQALVAMVGLRNIDAQAQKEVETQPQVYLETLITTAYQGAWSTLTSYFGDKDLNYTAARQIPVIVAQVSKPRVVVWLLLNVLLTISGVLLCMMQYTCNRPPLVDKFMPGECSPAPCSTS